MDFKAFYQHPFGFSGPVFGQLARLLHRDFTRHQSCQRPGRRCARHSWTGLAAAFALVLPHVMSPFVT